MAMLVVLLATGCADDGGGRQFASDERTAKPEMSPTVPPPSSGSTFAATAVASPLADTELLAVQSGVGRVATVVDGKPYLIDVAEGSAIELEGGGEARAWHAVVDPAGELVAVLVSPTANPSRWEIRMFDTSGALLDTIPVKTGPATAAAGMDIVAAGVGGLDWSPDGTRLAVALPSGGLYLATLDGAVETMASPRRVPIPDAIAWSQTGTAVSYVSRPSPAAGGGVNAASVNALPIDPVLVFPADPSGNRSATQTEWMGNGEQALTLVERAEFGTQLGSLFQVGVGQQTPRLEWTAGSLPNSPGAISFAVAPDSRVVAIVVREQRGALSLVLHQLGGGSQIVIPLGIDADRADVAWTEAGVAVVAANGEPDAGGPVLALVDSTGAVAITTFGDAPGTPVASPIPASPVASPRAATPGASPASASPIASSRFLGVDTS